MVKPFDAVSKRLMEAGPGDWFRVFTGRDTAPPTAVIDSDLAAVTAAADKVLRVAEAFEGHEFWLLHAEFMSGLDLGVPARLSKYRTLLEDRHGVPAGAVLVLLRREANSPTFTGTRTTPDPLGGEHRFVYRVLRLWEIPPEVFLAGGVTALPLAAVSAVPDEGVPAVVERMRERAEAESEGAEERGEFWTAVQLLMGLRADAPQVAQWLRGVHGMQESSTYQAILAEGEARGEARGAIRTARALLLELGAARFGNPDPETRSRIHSLSDSSRLSALALKVLRAESWATLLADEG